MFKVLRDFHCAEGSFKQGDEIDPKLAEKYKGHCIEVKPAPKMETKKRKAKAKE